MDGAVSRAAVEGSVSAVCRDSQGHYLGSKAMKIPGMNDPATLEALACREAMALALDLGLTHVEIACDNKGVVGDINQRIGGNYVAVVKEINPTLNQFYQCTFIFEGRGINLEAHSLAKHIFGLGLGHHVWSLNPPNLLCMPMNIAE